MLHHTPSTAIRLGNQYIVRTSAYAHRTSSTQFTESATKQTHHHKSCMSTPMQHSNNTNKLKSKVRLPIIVYHSIDTRGTLLSTHPDTFEAQMKFLATHGWETITLSKAAHLITNGKQLPAKSVVLTFDDGMQSIRDVADPILQSFGFTATTFIVTNQVGKCPNWFRLHNAYRDEPLLDIEALEKLKARGWELQPHTHDHPVMSHLPLSIQVEQISHCRSLMEKWFGGDADVLAYPFGQINDDTINAMTQCNMKAGVTLRFSAFVDPQSPFTWPRLGSAWFKSSDLRQRLALAGIFEQYVHVKGKIKGDRSKHFQQPSEETTRGLCNLSQ